MVQPSMSKSIALVLSDVCDHSKIPVPDSGPRGLRGAWRCTEDDVARLGAADSSFGLDGLRRQT